jgi:catechol 2,3-dioxygenase-like lactoylglutathione lyase family enzyme
VSSHPIGNRGIDHLVLCVRDLDAAQRLYQSLGFTTTPPARHPFGTGNSLVQLQGNFLELLAIVEPDKIKPPAPGYFGFADFCREFLRTREGLAMLVFESDDARRDQAEFAGKNLQTYQPFDFSRQATLPDGSQVTVAFSLAFVTDPRLSQAAFFVCQQHAPEYFWKTEYQSHANGAQRVDEIIMVASQPLELTELFAGLQGAEQVHHEAGRLTVTTARGRISVLDRSGFAERFPMGDIENAPDTPYFAGFGVTVADIGRTRRLLTENNVTFYQRGEDRVQITPAVAGGVFIEFRGGG